MRSLAAQFTFVVVLFAAGTAVAETTVSARLDPETVEVGQRFDYIIEVVSSASHGIEFKTAPDFGELNMLGSGKRTSFRPRAGNAARQFTMNFTLSAPATGEFAIEPPLIVVGSREFRLPVRRVNVVEKGKAPRARPEANAKYAIEATVQPDRAPYVGEQITVSYVLLRDATTPRVQPAPPDEPSLDDFWIEDLTDGRGYQQRTVLHHGKHYEQMSLRVYGLFPLKAGPATIEPMKVDLQIGGFFQRPQTVSVSSDAIELDVKPLPPDAPDGFSEANVGSWKFSTTVDHRATKVGRPITLELVAEGRGHVDRIVLPELPELSGAKVTHTEENVRRHRGSKQVGGRKTVRISLMPTSEGTLEIPSIDFHYFDPDTGSYATESSRPIEVKVAPGVLPEQTAQKRAEARSAADGTDVVNSLTDSLLPPRRDTDHAPAPSPLGSWWFILLAAIPVVGLLAIALERPTREARARRSPARARAAALDEAIAAIETAQGWSDLYVALREFLAVRFDIPSGRVTASELEEVLHGAGIPESTAAEAAELLGDIESRRFGGGTAEIDESNRERLAALVRALEGRRDPRATSAVTQIVLMVGILLTASPALATTEARQAWDKGDFERAAQQWAEAADNAPDNPSLHFNAGTAYARAESFGPARLHLERAALLAPLDAEISDQLDTVRRIVRLQAIESGRTGKTLDGDEPLSWWRLGSAMWPPAVVGAILLGLWLAFLAALLRRFNQRPAVRDAAFVAMVIGALVALLGLSAALLRHAALDNVDPAVQIVDELVVRDGPSPHAKPLDVPRSAIPGTVVRIVEERGDWTKIALPGEQEGWTARDSIVAIERRH